MKRLSFCSWLGMALVLGVFGVACGDDDDDDLRGSGEGESCVRSSDCASGLACIGNFCTEGGGEGGDNGGPAPGPVLGGEGESCTRRADCETGLLCVDQRCVDSDSSAGGDGNTPAPRLGARGESCQTVSDCGAGLTCILRALGGVCDLADYGLEPTGNTCGGECLEAADCCELPPDLANQYRSCENLVAGALMGNLAANCPAAGPAVGFEVPCFHYRTYCDCADDAWECTDNRCSYVASCNAPSVDTFGGCPSASRSDRQLTTTCTDGACAPATCGDTPDCVGLPMADLGENCVADECVCVEDRCYRGCDEDLDCPVPYSCVEGACTEMDACVTDAQCARATSDATAECRAGSCVIPCVTDQDCGDSGARGGGNAFNGFVCGSDNTCQQVGCTEDAECAQGNAVNGIRMFCVPATAAGAPVRSATTD